MNKENYHLSKYIVSAKVDDDNYICLSSMSCSLIKLEKEKYFGLLNMNLSLFTDEEIKKMIKMGFITCHDEFAELSNLRKSVVDKISEESLGLSILTTSLCNARCYYCYEKGIHGLTMSIKEADKVIEFIIKNYHNKPVHITWFGGEPLLNYSIIDYICQKLRDFNIPFHSSIISNGYLFDKIKKEQFLKWNLLKAQITIDGIDNEYNRIKNYIYKENAFEKVMSNISYLIENKINVAIRINYDPKEINNAINVIEYIYKKFGRNKYINVYCFNVISENVTNVNEYKERKDNPYLLVMQKLFDYGYLKSLQSIGFRNNRTYCGVFHNFYVINPDGTLFKCEHSCSKEDEKIGIIGKENINKKEMEYWLDTNYLMDECKNCKILPCCQGGCKSMLNQYGPNVACSPLKKYAEDLLLMYYNSKM